MMYLHEKVRLRPKQSGLHLQIGTVRQHLIKFSHIKPKRKKKVVARTNRLLSFHYNLSILLESNLSTYA
jgi:hypothetical protein